LNWTSRLVELAFFNRYKHVHSNVGFHFRNVNISYIASGIFKLFLRIIEI
jgi:hypothetical protein